MKKFPGDFRILWSDVRPPLEMMHIYMVVHFLIPGMEDLNNTGCRAKIFRVCGQFQESSSAAFVGEAVEQFLVTVKERIEFVRQSKHHMKV